MKVRKLIVDFEGQAYRELKYLAEKLDTSISDVLSKALALLDLTIEEQEKGNSMTFVSECGCKKVITLLK